jgi:hypothetical protein
LLPATLIEGYGDDGQAGACPGGRQLGACPEEIELAQGVIVLQRRSHSAHTIASASSSSASVDVSMVIVLTPFPPEGGEAGGPLAVKR